MLQVGNSPIVDEPKYHVHLIFHDQADSNKMGMDFGLVSLVELQCLQTEVCLYNEHAENLMKGLVSKHCYADPEDANLFLRASRENRFLYTQAGFPEVGQRAYFEGREYKRYFQIVCHGPRPDCFIDSFVVESRNNIEAEDWEYEPMSHKELVDLLETPLPMDDVYSMGYRILPMTEVLSSRCSVLSDARDAVASAPAVL
jgi:hypothetical protein